MHDAHFLCYKVSQRVAQTQSRHPPHSRSPHSHSPHTSSPHTFSPHSHALQELKDDLLNDTAWPVVMPWFNEDHQRPLNRSSFKNTALRTGHDLSDHQPLNLLESCKFILNGCSVQLKGYFLSGTSSEQLNLLSANHSISFSQECPKQNNFEFKMRRDLIVQNVIFS